jgi:hypothetical protein
MKARLFPRKSANECAIDINGALGCGDNEGNGDWAKRRVIGNVAYSSVVQSVPIATTGWRCSRFNSNGLALAAATERAKFAFAGTMRAIGLPRLGNDVVSFACFPQQLEELLFGIGD